MGVEILRAARAADASQAAYFQETLAAEYKSATADLACARESLRDVTEGHVVGYRAAARARAKVRHRQYQVFELERLLAGLDRRFGTRSAER